MSRRNDSRACSGALPPLLALVCGLQLSHQANAQQQAPSQHSPAVKQYQVLPGADKAKADERITSTVTLKWRPIPQAQRYLIKIARNPDLSQIFYTVETVQTTYQTPELLPGAYYYIVEGYQDEKRVGQTTTKGFVVGKPLALDARKERLPAPTIVGPKHLDLYPTYGYVRLAWKPVDGARGYRFRLWNEDRVRENQRWKRDTPPRWVTEVPNPWIEVHDAPYSSYMYLESGIYRWDVAAVDKDGGYIGDPAIGYFEVGRRWFFKPSEVFLRLEYGFAPNYAYYQDSSDTGQQGKLLTNSHRLQGEVEWWFARQWGLNAGTGFRSLNLHSPSFNSPHDTIFAHNSHFDMLFRTYLSSVPWGWWFTFNLGLGLQEFPQVDSFDPISNQIRVSRPKALGARTGVELNKRWNNPLQLKLKLNHLIHAYTLSSPTGDAKTNTPLDLEFTARLLYHWSPHFATSLALGVETKRNQYTPVPALQRSNVHMLGWAIAIGGQFNYFPAADNSTYYPAHRDSSYYPSERKKGYYRSEERNIDDHQKDSSAWQRWRPR